MVIYLAQFAINERLDKKKFVEEVINWRLNGKYDIFKSLEWDGESFSKCWEEDGKKLLLEELPKKGIVSMRFMKDDGYGRWITDLILNASEKYVTVRVTLERTEFTTEFYPSYQPPAFIKKLIFGGYAGYDRELPIDKGAHSLDDYPDVLNNIVEKKLEYSLPIVFVSKKDEGSFPVSFEELAFSIQGLAHVLYDGDIVRLSDYKDYFGCESNNGIVFIIYPNKNMKRAAINLFGSSNDNPEYIISRVKTNIYNYSNQLMKRDIDTWSGVQNEKLYEENEQLISSKKALKEENEDFIDTFEEQMKKMEAENRKLREENQVKEAENQALRLKLTSRDKKALIYMGEEPEFYEGEIREIVLEILEKQQKNVKPGSRREHIISDILNNNEYGHLQSERRNELKNNMKGYKTLDGSLRNFIEKFGFDISEEGSHYKWTYFGDKRYFTTVAKSGSDTRAGLNIFSAIDNDML